MQRLPAVTRDWFSLFRFRSPLLTESRLLSLPVGTEMFHFPTFPPLTLCVQVRVTGHDSCRVSPFGHPRITARLAAPRGFSQPPTSFIGSWCQGIHRAPLLTWPQSFLMLASTVQFSRYGREQSLGRRVPTRTGTVRSGSSQPFDEGLSHSGPTPAAEAGRRRESEVRDDGASVPSVPNSVPRRGRPVETRSVLPEQLY